MAEKLIIFCHSSILIIKMYIRQTEEEQTSKHVGSGAKERNGKLEFYTIIRILCHNILI